MIQKIINQTKTGDMLFLAGIVLNIMNESIYMDQTPSVLPELFNTMGIDGTMTLIKYFGGETIKIPSHEDMYKSFLILACYYKKKLEDKPWEKIKEEIGIDINPHTLGKMIQTIDERINLEMGELKEMGIDKFLEKFQVRGVKNE